MTKDFFRYCDKAKMDVDMYDCEKCQETDCPKHIQVKPWRTLTPEEFRAISESIKD